MSTMTRNGYIPVFKGDKMSIYDARNTKITVLRAAVLGGWYVPHKKIVEDTTGQERDEHSEIDSNRQQLTSPAPEGRTAAAER